MLQVNQGVRVDYSWGGKAVRSNSIIDWRTQIMYKKLIIFYFTLFFSFSFFLFFRYKLNMVKLSLFITIAASVASISSAYPMKHTPTSSGILSVSSPSFLPYFPFRGSNALNPIPTGPIKSKSYLKASSYPRPWVAPDVNHPEVQKAINSIDWNHVPKFAPRVMGMEYDEEEDPACWWTNTQCTNPKATYLPADVKFCPNAGDFGLVSTIFQKKNLTKFLLLLDL